MPSTVQLNTRIDPGLKARGDAVFARAGLTSSEVVRAVWEAAARTQELPDCVRTSTEAKHSAHSDAIKEGAGIVRRMAEEMGVFISATPPDYHALRDEAYDALIDEMEARHA
ncbi:MAG: type II toxin-antitoxin system RelB/DinJ family antitoxin [Atopobiaceae bacterium]|nr:type II toxin-antitoxin system RelB/DinJ family antitoxin [Atopobiaceae bacterium]MBR1829993.1 type II toxin-antitoxin system RelB/DinJ family antitoxin [Atopobiaceae bacterium]